MRKIRISDLKFKTKISLGFAVIILLFGANAFYTMTILNMERDQLLQINAESVPASDFSTQIQTNWLKGRYHMVQYVLGEDLEEATEGLTYIDTTQSIIKRALPVMQSSNASGQIIDAFTEIDKDVEKYSSLTREYIEIAETSVDNSEFKEADLASLYNEMVLLSKKIDDESEFIAGSSFEDIKGNIKDAELVMIQAIASLTTILIIIIVLGLLIAYFLSSTFAKSIKKGIKITEQIAGGDLTVNIDVKMLSRKDEIGSLARAMDKMRENLDHIIGNLMNGVVNITLAGEEMSQAAQKISSGANEQASSAEEVSSTMEEITSNIEQNSSNASKTKTVAEKTTESVEKGNKVVQETVDSINNISEKIKIINDIAFQTNILALNAAVESARAGEEGKGFAVVASEVRKLAELSRNAADDIIKISKQTVEVSEDAGEALQNIVPEIRQTSSLVEEITASSYEQKSGANQVNEALSQLSMVIQQNAASAEEMSASSEELANQAEEIRQLVKFFKTNTGDASIDHNTSIFEEKLDSEEVFQQIETSDNEGKLHIEAEDLKEFERY